MPECYKSSATIAGEAKSNLVYHETAHDAPVNALTKIDVIRRAHGVRVVSGVLDSERLPARKTDRGFPNVEPIAKQNLRFKDAFGFALGLPNGLRYLRVGGRGFCLGAGKC